MVKINILQGKNEVGGNCIVVADGANKVFFDQGIRFSRFKKFYKGNITPSGFSEMQRLKIIPSIQEPSEIYITHYHLDHLGLLHAYSLVAPFTSQTRIFSISSPIFINRPTRGRHTFLPTQV